MRLIATPAPRSTPARLDRRFEAIVFDWDGTAVPDRQSDAGEVRDVIEALCAAGLDLAIVSGTHVDNVDGQLRARPGGPGRLWFALNRGSEMFAVDAAGPHLVERRAATAAEDAALDEAAARTVAALRAHDLETEIVSSRLNRRKIDLIPLPEWSDPPKASFDLLLDAVTRRVHEAGIGGLREVVDIAEAAARASGLSDPRITSDAKHVEIGLTDKSDSARWLARDLAARGIAPALLLIAGDEFGTVGALPGSDSLLLVPELEGAAVVSVGVEPNGVPAGVHLAPGGPTRFLEVLRDQLARRTALDLPWPDEAPGWTLVVDGFDARLERAREALLTLADGAIGTSGSPLLSHPAATPGVLVANVYDGSGPEAHLLSAPPWHSLPGALADDARICRILELRTGVLHEEINRAGERIRAVRFSSLARPGTAVLRAERPADGEESRPLSEPDDADSVEEQADDGLAFRRVVAAKGGVVALTTQRVASAPDRNERLDRITVIEGDPDCPPDRARPAARLRDARAAGFDALLLEHRAAWARRWADADVVVEGDDELQLALRFGLFHLIGSAADRGEAAVGARGLSGPAYRGHVFWDADVFVLPFLAATHPASARAMLEYRVRRLPAALEAAREEGLAGARFPWESAGSGNDVTPPLTRDRSGAVIPIRTGGLEVHIVADVAWAAACYVDWTGDAAFARGAGRRIFVETARYWASRTRVESDGSAHILGVVGPDEYHEPVDDNAFTNVMARWNLRRAAAEVGDDVIDPGERRRWLSLADSLVDGYDPETGIYEQFAGFHQLEPLVIEDVAPRRPIAADLLLGRRRVSTSQVVKQPDVLMLHHLVPDEVEPGSLEPNLRFYEPRTAHGSSLSPGVYASLFARARDDDRALEALGLAARIDLDDLTDTTAGGLHLATFGTLWQALAFGYAGLRPTAEGLLAAEPRLPHAWSAFEVGVRFRGSRVRVRKEGGVATVTADPPVQIKVDDSTVTADPSGCRLVRHGHRWEVT